MAPLLAEQTDPGLGLLGAGLEAMAACRTASCGEVDDTRDAECTDDGRPDLFGPTAGETDRPTAWHAGLRRHWNPAT